MRESATVLDMLQARGKRGVPVDDLYRQLYNPSLYLRAYGRIYANDGAMTPGSTPETADAMSLKKITQIIDDLKHERYRWTPVRRTYVPKKNGRLRPLGLPTWTDKLLQEVIRSLLEAYYEPQFSDASHGFRPGRGCHTALSQIRHAWTGVRWFVEGDLEACFDRLDHTVLLNILAEKIHDHRFLRLIKHLLQAGYLEDWRYHSTLSGAPQGSIVSPILSNIYLDQLDHLIETELIPQWTSGQIRGTNPAYARLKTRIGEARKKGEPQRAQALLRQAQRLPSKDPHDPGYRRLKYVRYADDLLLGFVGSRREAEHIKAHLGELLKHKLHLTLSQEKTLITHAHSQQARFLGYGIQTQHRDDKLSADGHRRINLRIALRVPAEVIQKKTAFYQHKGKPLRRLPLTGCSDYTILNTYQQELRGLIQYYALANNVCWFNRVQWAARQSLLQTLATKYRSTTTKMAKRFASTVETPNGERNCLEAILARPGKEPLVARFGGIPLITKKNAVPLDLNLPPIRYEKKEVIRRLIAHTCELCGTKEDDCIVHQVRKLAELEHMGKDRPLWAEVMLKRRRKTLIVCQSCHHALHEDGRR